MSAAGTVREAPADVVARLRKTFRTGRTRDLGWRTAQLTRLRALLTERGDELAELFFVDFEQRLSRPRVDAVRDHMLTHAASALPPKMSAAGT